MGGQAGGVEFLLPEVFLVGVRREDRQLVDQCDRDVALHNDPGRANLLIADVRRIGDNATMMCHHLHPLPDEGIHVMKHREPSTSEPLRTSRRKFLSATAATAFGFTIVPRHVLGGAGQTAPSDRVNVAGIGVGGMGGGDIATVSKLGTNIVALCDVDDARAAGSFNAFPQCATL